MAFTRPRLGQSSAQTTTQLYYWVTPIPVPLPNELGAQPRQSFAIAVEAIRAKPGEPGFAGHIAAGSVDYNKNYFAPGQPVWNWHVASVDEVYDLVGRVFPACLCPYLVANPSDIAADPAKWIADNGDLYAPEFYAIGAQIDPAKPSTVANVSNRAFTSAGEKTAITGLIISGGQPRSVIVRGLGPSLADQGVEGSAQPEDRALRRLANVCGEYR